ncbi:hypothetical protein GCM10027040_10160 [Halomonas shantousis]
MSSLYPLTRRWRLALLLLLPLSLSACVTGPRFANLEARIVPPEALDLPADAELTVRLERLTRSGPEPIAEGHYIRLGQGPIPVTLRYDDNAIDSGRTYGLEAEIRHAGQRLYATDKPVPVFTGAAPPGEISVPVEPVNR